MSAQHSAETKMVQTIEDISMPSNRSDSSATLSSDMEKASTTTAPPIDPIIESQLLRRQDCTILPLMALTLMFGYLDRGNIGNARILGMQKDLSFTQQQYLDVVMMFFFGYMIIELPAGMALRYCQPRYVFSGALVLFGMFSCLFCVAEYEGLLGLRFLLGLAEAFANNAFIFVSLWYRPEQLALRTAAVYSLTPIAGAVSGLISYGVGTGLNGTSGLASWQWLFLIEGIGTIAFGLALLFLLPGLPESVASHGTLFFRNPSQRACITQRLKAGQNTTHATFQLHQVWLALRDPKFWLGSLVVGPVGIGIGAFNVFLPTLVKEFGFTPLHSQLLSIIPYAFALLSMLVFSYLADRIQQKGYITLFCMGIVCAGFIILLSTTNKTVGIAGACFVASGAYPALTVAIAWVMTMHGGYTKRATSVWGTQLWVQTCSIVSTQVYRTPPRFFLGHGLSLGIYVLGMLACVLLMVITRRANAQRETRRLEFESKGEVDPDMRKSFEELGDGHPAWRYTL